MLERPWYGWLRRSDKGWRWRRCCTCSRASDGARVAVLSLVKPRQQLIKVFPAPEDLTTKTSAGGSDHVWVRGRFSIAPPGSAVRIRSNDLVGGAPRGHQSGNFARTTQRSGPKRLGMASLSQHGGGVGPIDCHGKEGVNGSSPLEGLRFRAWLGQILRARSPTSPVWKSPDRAPTSPNGRTGGMTPPGSRCPYSKRSTRGRRRSPASASSLSKARSYWVSAHARP